MNPRLPRGVLAFLLVGVILWGAVAAISPPLVRVHFGGDGDSVRVPVWIVGLGSLAACAFTSTSFAGSSAAARVWLFPILSAILTFALVLVLCQSLYPSSAGLATPIVSAAAATVALAGSRLLAHRQASISRE